MLELLIIIIGFIADRLTKLWAVTIKTGEGIEIIKNFFAFEYLENRGAAFGILLNKQMFLSVFTLVIILGLIIYLFKYRPKTTILKISLSMIISGALGNLYDRIIHKYVIDFIMVHYKDVYYFPTFNVADILVVVGTALLALCVIKEWN